MVKFADRVKLNLTTTGTGTVTFGTVVDGFQSLTDASVVDAETVRYTIESGTNYEVGTGTIGLAGGTYTMSRSPSSSSESDNSAINVGSGAVCFLTMLAEDVVQYLSDLNNVSSNAPSGGQTLSWDAGTNSWSPTSPSGGITSVGNYAGLPSSPSETDLAWVSDQKALYLYDGAEWDRVSTGSQLSPRYTTVPESSHNLNSDGTTSTLTAVAVDDAGFPVTYDWDAYSGSTLYSSSSLPPQLTAVAENSGVFTLTPTTVESNEGNFYFRVKASDGVLTTPAISQVFIAFRVIITIATRQTSPVGTYIEPTSTGVTEWYSNSSNSASAYNYFPEGGTVAAAGWPEGKRYIEAKWTASGGGAVVATNKWLLGIADRTAAHAHTSAAGFLGTSAVYMYMNNGNHYGVTGAATSSGLPASGLNDVFQIAYDTSAGKVWIGRNDSWSSVSGDPGAGGAGISLPYGANGYAFVIASGAGAAQRQTLTWHGEDYTKPAGFSYF